LALCNWDDTPRRVSLPLAGAGIRGERFLTYDVWGERPLPDVTTAIEAEVAAHDVVVVAVRPVTTRAQVLASSRHVVQGAVDILEEEWDQPTRTLRVKSGALDARPYTVTVAVPKGLVPGACTADVPCNTHRLPSGHLVLEWPGSATVQEISWTVRFRAAPRAPAR
jgi:hypothetical protein